jgi:glycosyltransferase involved in cell wall biosynthesis
VKILFLSHYYFPEGNAPASRVCALAERWARDGHDVTVVTCAPNVPDGKVYDGYANRWCVRETVNGVNVVRVWTYLAANKGAFRRMLNFASYFLSAVWRSLREPRPDVVIATSPQIFCGYAGVWVKRLRRIPLVIEIRDIWPESMGAVGAKIPRPAYKVLEWIERAMYRSADRIVTVGEGYEQKLAEKGVPREKMSVIMNGTDLEAFSPRPRDENLLAKFGLADKFVVSYIGTVGMACGLETMLDAAEKLQSRGDGAVSSDGRRLAFAVVGDGAVRADLEREVKGRGLSNIVFTGRQPKSSMAAWVSSSDVNLVHLRKSDLFTTVMPSKIFESAGCARPMIIGVDGFARKLVMDAKAGIAMEPGNAGDLVVAVETLAADPALCARLGKNAYDRIALVHNRDAQAKAYLELLARFWE